jgi:hypothetical protein
MRKAACALLLCAMMVPGCAGKVETIHTAADFDPAALETGIVALGGFVVATRLATDPAQEPPTGVAVDDPLAQSDAWSPLLYGRFLTDAPRVRTWPWSQVSGRVEPAHLAEAHAMIARGGVLRRDQLDELAAELPEVRYLAFARLDRNEVELQPSTEQAARTSWEREELENDTQIRDRSLTARRTVAVTLDLYDLRTGRSVWTTTASVEAGELYNFEEAQATEATGELADNPAVRVRGTPRQGPALDGVLEKACGKLVESLLEGRRRG